MNDTFATRMMGVDPVDPPHIDQWRGAFMFSLMWAWPKRWANNENAGDLRRYGAHYGVILMKYKSM